MSAPTAPVPPPPPPAARTVGPDVARQRAWLAAAVAVLLVLLYLSAEFTYSSTHLPPTRFHPVTPGASGRAHDADYRLLSLRTTDRWGTDLDDDAGSPDPGAVWVVAEMEITPVHPQQYVLCTTRLVATDGRSWASQDLTPVHEGVSCVPDSEHVQLGTTYPFVAAFQVPADEVGHLAGVGVETYGWRAQPLLRPPG